MNAVRGVSFEVAAPTGVADPGRMDVALFVGFVGGLEPGRPVLVESADDLQALGGVRARLDHVAAVTGAALADPLSLPPDASALAIVVDGAETRVALPAGPLPLDDLAALLNSGMTAPFAAAIVGQGTTRHLRITRRERHRPGRLTVRANSALGFAVASGDVSAAIDATLPAAVAAFFRAGGRRAWIVPTGAPEPYLASREARLRSLLRLLAPGSSPAAPPALSEDVARSLSLPPLARRRDPPQAWLGPAAALGVEEAFLLCLPDLVELLSPPPGPGQAALPAGAGPPESFAPCLVPAPAAFIAGAAALAAPALDRAGLLLWRRVVRHLLLWLAAEAPDRMLLLAAPPLLPEPLPRPAAGVVDEILDGLPEDASHLCQLAQPWLATGDSAGLAGGLVPPDAVLAGVLAQQTLTRGCFLSAAGAEVAAVRLAEALPDPLGRTARFERGAAGTVLATDRTPSPDPVLRHAAVRRLTALLLRSAARLGADAVFEPSGERLWRDLEIRLGLLLERILAAGGLRGEAAGTAFFARCGRSTMTSADIESGRVIAEVGFAPALPVERVQVRLALDGGRVTAGVSP